VYGGTSKTYRISSSISIASPQLSDNGIEASIVSVILPYSLNAHNGAIIAKHSTAIVNKKMAKVIMLLMLVNPYSVTNGKG
jgi:hypothetical protein